MMTRKPRMQQPCIRHERSRTSDWPSPMYVASILIRAAPVCQQKRGCRARASKRFGSVPTRAGLRHPLLIREKFISPLDRPIVGRAINKVGVLRVYLAISVRGDRPIDLCDQPFGRISLFFTHSLPEAVSASL